MSFFFMPVVRFMLCASLAVFGLLGCAGQAPNYRPTPTSDEFRGSYRDTFAPLFERAPFDLGCEPDSLTYKKLGDWNHIGVTGCGKKAVYILAYNGWAMNTVGTTADEE